MSIYTVVIESLIKQLPIELIFQIIHRLEYNHVTSADFDYDWGSLHFQINGKVQCGHPAKMYYI